MIVSRFREEAYDIELSCRVVAILEEVLLDATGNKGDQEFGRSIRPIDIAVWGSGWNPNEISGCDDLRFMTESELEVSVQDQELSSYI